MMKQIAVAAVAAAVAAGVGSYLAVRHAVGPGPGAASGTAETGPTFDAASLAPPTGTVSATAPTETAAPTEPSAGEPSATPRPESRPPAARPEPRPPAARPESRPPAARPEPAAPTPSVATTPAPRTRAPRRGGHGRAGPDPVEAATASRNRAPAPSARPVSPEPTVRPAAPDPAPRPAAASPTSLREATPEPLTADTERVATAAPPRPGDRLPVVEGWTRADGPGAPPTEAEPSPAAPEPLPTDTGLLDARAVGPGIAPGAPGASGTAPGSPPPLGTRAVTPALAPDLRPAFDELEIAAESVIGIQLETAVSTRTANIEDPVEARVERDVQVGPRVAIRSGTRMRGSVVLAEPAGRLRSPARLGVRFHTLLTDDGAEVPLSTETIYREGRSPGGDSAAKIGGAAVAGSILGAIFGGERGAAIGGSIGTAGGTAAALNGEGEPARLPRGSRLTVRLSRPAFVPAPR